MADCDSFTNLDKFYSLFGYNELHEILLVTLFYCEDSDATWIDTNLVAGCVCTFRID